jgi:hypothetical protein
MKTILNKETILALFEDLNLQLKREKRERIPRI